MELIMENYNHQEQERYERAKRKAGNIRGFYFNLMCYCIVIPGLVFINLMYTPDYHWFYFSMFGWGIGLCFHAMEAFGYNPFLGKDWEERKIKELLEKDKAKQQNTNTNNN